MDLFGIKRRRAQRAAQGVRERRTTTMHDAFTEASRRRQQENPSPLAGGFTPASGGWGSDDSDYGRHAAVSEPCAPSNSDSGSSSSSSSSDSGSSSSSSSSDSGSSSSSSCGSD